MVGDYITLDLTIDDIHRMRITERLGTLRAVQDFVFGLRKKAEESPDLGPVIDWLDAAISQEGFFLGRQYRLYFEMSYGGIGSLVSMEKKVQGEGDSGGS